MAISTNDLKNGMTLDLPEGLFQVVSFQHVKPGKGGAFVRTTLKNVRNGAVVDRTFRAAEKVDQAVVDKREMQFLYRDGEDLVFMDNTTYDQRHVPPAAVGDAANYIVDGTVMVMQVYNDEIIGTDMAASVELTVVDTEPGIQGDRVSGAKKAAKLETGAMVQVPLFINVGDKVKVDTRSGEYISKA
ncbi:MAG: elongation factor P [Actinomycetota bacterium]|nr:elongation factor P [Acidimicrobiia bacterium]MDQ3294798.1 elongation factor P [Actinomycetota bacterium]